MIRKSSYLLFIQNTLCIEICACSWRNVTHKTFNWVYIWHPTYYNNLDAFFHPLAKLHIPLMKCHLPIIAIKGQLPYSLKETKQPKGTQKAHHLVVDNTIIMGSGNYIECLIWKEKSGVDLPRHFNCLYERVSFIGAKDTGSEIILMLYLSSRLLKSGF